VLLSDCCCCCRTITSLYVGGVTPEITEDDLRDAFYTHGELAGVRKVRVLVATAAQQWSVPWGSSITRRAGSSDSQGQACCLPGQHRMRGSLR
jgi:hypothetical protein